jgi:LmbE family N-acetylglucosaminyl deacetylase
VVRRESAKLFTAVRIRSHASDLNAKLILMRGLIFLILIFLLPGTCLKAQNTGVGPRVLVVIAHPDDESTFSVTLYKIVKEQHGTVDLFVITNGEAGFKYCTLAEQYYGVNLTDEKAGRTNLPRIRKKELMNAGKILGISQYYFQDQEDAHYGLDEKGPLDSTWNTTLIKRHLTQLLKKKHYDFVFTLLPEPGTHGEHKAAAILALNTIAALPLSERPVILGAITQNKTDSIFKFNQYTNYLETQTITDTPLFEVDRTASFSYKNRVNYKVIANWEIAEHKSQGFTQMTMNDGDLEEFWYFKINGTEAVAKCENLFKLLRQVPYLSKVY